MRRMPVLVTAALIGSLAAVPAVVPSAAGAASPAVHPATHPVVLYASDGMRPDLMQLFAQGGGMPTYSSLMRAGATGDNGLTQGFPPNTGQGWYTLATGAWPGVHGSTNNTFFDIRQDFTTVDVVRLPRQRREPGHRPDERARGAVRRVGRRAGRQEGRAGRVDGRAEREHQRPDRRLRDVLLAARGARVPAQHDQADQRGVVRAVLPGRVVHAGDRLDERARQRRARAAGGADRSRRRSAASTRTAPSTCTSTRTTAAGYDRVLVVPTSAGKDGAKQARHARPGPVQRGQVPRRERPDRRRRRRDDRRLHEADRALAGPVALRAVLHLADPAERALRRPPRATRCRPARRARTGWPSTSPTTCRRRSSATSRRRRPGSSTRTPGTSRPSGSTRPTTARCSTTCSARCSRTPRCCSPAPTRPTR